MRSFRCKETGKLYFRQKSSKLGNIRRVPQQELRMLDDAENLEELAAVPGNRLEALHVEIADCH